MTENHVDVQAADDSVAPEPEDFGVEIAGWATGLPAWQQDIVARLAAGGELTADERVDAKSRILESVGFDDGHAAGAALSISPGAFGSVTGATTRLVSLGQLKGVNGLESDEPQTLEFSRDELTLVYGDNAAGKTSYARTLKHVGRSVGERVVILPDVKSTGSRPEPTAEIEIESGGSSEVLSVRLNAPAPPECAEIQAFDSQCSEVYVSEENRVDFTPQVLGIFDRLVIAQGAIRDEIQGRLDEVSALHPDFSEFDESTSAGRAVANLRADSDLDELRALATMSDVELQQFEVLKASLAASGPVLDQQIGAAQSAAAQATSTSDRMAEILAIVSDDAISRRAVLRQDAIEKTELASRAEKAAFGGASRSAEVATAWDVMWSAAHDYFHHSDEFGGEFPPDTDEAECPLCRQKLSPEARDRFKAFAEFVADESAASARQAREAQRIAEQALSSPLPAIDEATLNSLRAVDEDLADEVESFVGSAKARAISLRENDSADGIDALAPNPTPKIKAYGAQMTERANGLIELKDPEKRSQEEGKFKEFAERQRLSSMIEEIAVWHATLPERDALNAAKAQLNTSAITRKHGELADRVISDTYLANLEAELEILGLDYFNVKPVPRGQAGARVVRIAMTDFDPEFKLPDVLSEGEQRGLGLACFLAEVKTLGGDGPIVLDDPVSSFDQNRRERVAKRLHDESLHRQVVVFSHDLPFAYYLRRVGVDRQKKIALRYVRRKSGKPGFVANEGPEEMLKPGTLVQRLKEEVPRRPDEETNGRVATALFVQGWYSMLRSAWERTVERVLFNDVVTRFERAVKTQSLKQVRVDDDLVRRVTDGMTKCSKFPHDAPIADGVELPLEEEMLADAEDLASFIRDVGEAQKSV